MSIVEKQLTAFYPDCYVEQVEDYNIFQPNSKVVSHYIVPKEKFFYPIKTYNRMTADPLNAIVNSLSKIDNDEGAAIQIMVRPRKDGWQQKGRKIASRIFQSKGPDISWYNPLSWFSGMFEILVRGKGIENMDKDGVSTRTTPITDEEVKAIEEKNAKSGFETIIRLVSAAKTKQEAFTNLIAMRGAVSQYSTTNCNQFDYTRWHSNRTLVSNFIFRNFRRGLNQWFKGTKMLLSPEELSSIFHIPNIRFNKQTCIAWQNFKIAAAPPNIPKEGILLGHNIYRGESKEIRMKREDRFRHFYVIGQTGTGKSSILQTMIRQDLRNGDGICVIDPHGSLIKDILIYNKYFTKLFMNWTK